MILWQISSHFPVHFSTIFLMLLVIIKENFYLFSIGIRTGEDDD